MFFTFEYGMDLLTDWNVCSSGVGQARHGHVFSVGGGSSDSRLGVYTPPEKKRSPVFLQKVFYYVEKIAIPPNQVWSEVWRSLGGVYTPHAHVWDKHAIVYSGFI